MSPQKRAAFDVATLLNDRVVDKADVAAVAESVEPQNPMYKQTEQALAAYRVLAMEQGAAPMPPLPALPSGAKPVGVGGWYAAVPAALDTAAARGRCPAAAVGDATKAPQSYNAEVAAAVKHYQERHGLQDDGKLGAGDDR